MSGSDVKTKCSYDVISLQYERLAVERKICVLLIIIRSLFQSSFIMAVKASL